jgi:hypothetical protein
MTRLTRHTQLPKFNDKKWIISLILVSQIAAATESGTGYEYKIPSVNGVSCPHFFPLLDLLLRNANTTVLRKEEKWVLEEAEAKRFLAELEKKFGKLKLRDVPKEGTANVTRTAYSRDIPMPPTPSGEKRAAKIRVREYGSRPLDGHIDDITIAEGYEDRAKLEVKIGHPDEEDVVLKPWGTVLKSDIKTLLDSRESYYQHVDEIKKRTLALPENADAKMAAQIESEIDTLRSVHDYIASPGKIGEFPEGLKSLRVSLYERDAFRLSFVDRHDGSKINTEMTLDKNMRSGPVNGTPEEMTYYPDHWRGLEIKTPLKYAKMSDEELKTAVPELYQLRLLTRGLKQVKDIPAGTGKAGGGKLLASNQIAEKGVPLNFDLEAQIGQAVEASGSIGAAKRDLRTKMANRSAASYFEDFRPELRRVGEARVQVPRATKESIAALRDDVAMFAELELNELDRMSERKVLSAEGKAYLQLTKEFRKFLKTSREGWLASAIDDKFSTWIHAQAPAITLQDMYRALLDDYVRTNGKLVSKLTLAQRAERFKQSLNRHSLQRRWNSFADLARERFSKKVVGTLVAAPVTIPIMIGAWYVVGVACSAIMDECPLGGKAALGAKNRGDEKKQAESRKHRKEAAEEIDSFLTQHQNESSWSGLEKGGKALGSNLWDRLFTTEKDHANNKALELEMKEKRYELLSHVYMARDRLNASKDDPVARHDFVVALAGAKVASWLQPGDDKSNQSLDAMISEAHLTESEMAVLQQSARETLSHVKDELRSTL